MDDASGTLTGHNRFPAENLWRLPGFPGVTGAGIPLWLRQTLAGSFRVLRERIPPRRFPSSVPLKILVSPLVNDTGNHQAGQIIYALQTHLKAGA